MPEKKLRCPKCSGRRITQDFSAVITYRVQYFEAYDMVDTVEPADVVRGHTQYELGSAISDEMECANPDCRFTSSDLTQFLPE